MSGGSYNYLCHKNPEELVGGQSCVDEMAERLSGLGYAGDAARETYELLLLIRQFETRAGLISERLYAVWRAVEWWDSCDSSEGVVKTELEKYRKPE